MRAADNDVTTVVLEQHKHVAHQLNLVRTATGSARADELDLLASMLDVHESAEETVIYPTLRKLGAEGTRAADKRTHEEGVAKEILTQLKVLDTGSQAFEVLFAEFSAMVHAHAASEETEVIPLLRSWCAKRGDRRWVRRFSHHNPRDRGCRHHRAPEVFGVSQTIEVLERPDGV